MSKGLKKFKCNSVSSKTNYKTRVKLISAKVVELLVTSKFSFYFCCIFLIYSNREGKLKKRLLIYKITSCFIKSVVCEIIYWVKGHHSFAFDTDCFIEICHD